MNLDVERMYGLKNTSSMMICFWLNEGSFQRCYARILTKHDVDDKDAHNQEGDIDNPEDAGAGHDDEGP